MLIALSERARISMNVEILKKLKNGLAVAASEQTAEFMEIQWRSWTIILNFISSGYLHAFSEKKVWKHLLVVVNVWYSNDDS